jgi:predicted dehydrogenase
VLLIGCGKIAGRFDDPAGGPVESHAAAIAGHPDFTIRACVDADAGVAKAFAEKYAIERFYTSVAELPETADFDVAVISTPDATHFSVAKSLFASREKPLGILFMEKPVCQHPGELAELLALSAAAEIPVVVNMSRRFHALYRQLRQRSIREQTGRLIRADIYYYGGWRHNGIHMVDTLNFLFGGRFTDIQILDSTDTGTEDPTLSVKCLLAGEDAEVWIHGLSDQHYQLFDLDLKYTNGRLQIRNFEADIRWETVVTNNRGEKVLVASNLFEGIGERSPLETAYAELHEYLSTGNLSILEPVTLKSVSPSMQVIWSVND